MSEAAALQAILSEFGRLRELVEESLKPDDQRLLTAGLIGYEGLRECLAIDGQKPCMRKVKQLVRRHRAVIRPVEMGHRLVGFRPARVEAFIAALAGDEKIGGSQL